MEAVSKIEVREARAWLCDCVWADVDEDDILDLADAAIVRGVERHFEGGWAEFTREV
jgi:hypothetical protein